MLVAACLELETAALVAVGERRPLRDIKRETCIASPPRLSLF
jgi:hypothetical protein